MPAVEHATPCTCQTTFWFPVPSTDAVKPCTASGDSVMLPGCTDTSTRLSTVICALALFVESAALTAVALTGFGEGIVPGARYSTCGAVVFVTIWQGIERTAQISPNAVFPPAIPFRLQITPVFEVPFTCAFSVTR